MLVIVELLKAPFFQIEDKNCARAAAHYTVFSIWRDGKLADSRLNDQITMVKREECIARTQIDDFE